MPKPRTIKVFIASPGDLAVERRAFKEVLDELNKGFGDGAGVEFEPLAWEETLAVITRRSQGLINQEIDRCDVFVLAMHRRWGQEAPDAKPYSSYTEEEFYRAFDRWHRTETPTIFVFFKDIDPAQMADPGKQLQLVLDFRRQLEVQRQLIYRPFADLEGFEEVLQRHLKAYVKGQLPKADVALAKVILPQHAIEEVKKERAEKEAALAKAEKEHQAAEAAVARAEAFALEFAERASKAALEGRVEEARQDFAKATDGTANLQVLYLAFQFYYRTGELAIAEELLERWLAISGPDAETASTAAALGNLAGIYHTRGDLDRAEEMCQKALYIDEKLGQHEGMAIQYGNLGLIYMTRGDLDRAEEMYRKSLDIDEKLGQHEGLASDYGNLGLIFMARSDLETAEEMHRKSLEIAEKLGRQEGMAASYGNLGEVYQNRGELDRARAMHQRALDIHEKLGRQEGMANDCANLGLVAKARGDQEQAQELWTKARDLYARIGMPHMVKKHQGWLDSLPKTAAKAKWVRGGTADANRATKGKKKATTKAKGIHKKGTRKKKA